MDSLRNARFLANEGCNRTPHSLFYWHNRHARQVTTRKLDGIVFLGEAVFSADLSGTNQRKEASFMFWLFNPLWWILILVLLYQVI